MVSRLVEKFRVHSQEARAEALDSLTTSFLSSRLHGSYEQAKSLILLPPLPPSLSFCVLIYSSMVQ